MIKRPVETGYCSDEKVYAVLSGCKVVIKHTDKDIINEIAAALNGPKEGAFEWAVKWMMEHPSHILMSGGNEYMFNSLRDMFYYRHNKNDNWHCFNFEGQEARATDWRIAEVG